MYRIKLASGAEETYHSIEEFAAALHSGTVTAEASIYHQRADRWLSVTNHPHYQIALSRAPGGAKADASKRQVVSAVRPASEVPPTRKLTIPTPKKPEAGPLRAQENVLEGVVVTRPAAQQTTAMPIRSAAAAPAKPQAKAPEPVVPDLGSGLDLVEESLPAQPEKRPSTATPQVDKLLEMLEPAEPVKAAAPVAASAKPTIRPIAGEVLDLGAPMPPLPAEPVPPLGLKLEEESHPAPNAAATPARPPRGNGKIIGLVAAAVLVIGAVMFIWKPWNSSKLPEGTEIASTTLPRTEAFGGSTATPAPTTAQITGSPAPAGAAVDSAKAPARDSAPSIVRVAAPRNIKVAVPTPNLIATSAGSTVNISATELIQHYNVAYTDARSELELRMLQIGFTQIFLRSRLTTNSGVEDTRRLIASANSALRQYRSQENQIERAYQDTMGVAGRNLGWTPRDLSSWNTKAGQKESAETLRLTNLMLSQMEGVFILLNEQEGKYQVSGETISFEDPEAARQYSALRVWLNQQADKYAGTGDALPATLRQVVKAIGATRLPQERK